MVKYLQLIGLSAMLYAQTPTETALQKNCLACHIQQKIPSELIYRRYLLRYSTHRAIRQTLLAYLQHPTKETSIMPEQFFLKFPMKGASNLNHTVVLQNIDAYLNHFDIRKKLILPQFTLR